MTYNSEFMRLKKKVSKLSVIKNSFSQQRQKNDLSTLAIENESTKSLSYEEVTEDNMIPKMLEETAV